jgi:hypothetical protein
MSAGTIALRRAADASLRTSRAAVREQALVAGGQILSGVGNLLYAAVMARMLTPGGFAELAAFLALYLLIAVPSLSLAAGGALDPERARRRRGKVLVASLPVSLGLAVAAVALAPTLGLSVATGLALATTPTLVALIELDRGRLYGERAYGWVTGSLVAEPLVRLAVGVTLAAALGVAGGAIGVVAGGIAGLAVARAGRGPDRRTSPAVPYGRQASIRNSGAREAGRRGAAGRLAALTFLFLAVVQCQDIVFANATLGGVEAARFAAISTLGGAAVFATATIPFVLMPRAKAGEPGALGAALGTAALLGGGAALVTAIAAEPILILAFGGGRFDAVASFLPAYMLAMALLGIARVLAADAAAHGARRVPWIALAAGVLQLVLLVTIGDTAEGIGLSTLIAAGALTAALTLDRVPTHVDGPKTRHIGKFSAHQHGGLVRVAGEPGSGLDSAAGWAVRPFRMAALYPAARRTLLQLTRNGTKYGITPGEGWTGGNDPWTAPTAWSAWALAALAAEPHGPDGRDPRTNLPAVREGGGPSRRAALELIADLRRAATPAGDLPERVDVHSGVPTSTTPLLWSSAFTVLALRELWP